MADNKVSVIIGVQDQATAGLAKIGKSVESLSSTFGAFASSLSVGAIAAFTKALIDSADEMNDMAARTGMAVEALAKYKLAADQNGSSLEAVGKGIKALSSFMVENREAMKAAGITATDADGAFRQLADLFKAMPDPAERSALATKLFGKAGQDLLPVLIQGSEALDAAAEKAAKYAAAMKQLAPQADEFSDNLAELKLNLTALSINALQPMMEGLIGLARLLNDAAAGGERMANALSFLAEKSKTLGAVHPIVALQARALDLLAQNAAGGTPGSRTATGKIGGIPAGIGTDTADSISARLAANVLLNGQGTGPGAARGGGRRTAGPARSPFANMGSFLSNDAGDIEEVMRRNADLEEDRAREVAAVIAETESGKLESRRAAMQAAAKLFEESAISEQQWIEFGIAQNDKLAESTKDLKAPFDELARHIEQFGKRSSDALVDFALTGKMSFGDMITSMMADIAKMIAYENVTKPLFDGISAGVKAGGIGDWLSGLFGGAKANADGGVYQSASLHRHLNTVVDRPTFFAFARGGVFGEAGAEAIMPLAKDSQGRLGVHGGGNSIESVRVEIRNEGRPQEVVSASPRFDPEGLVIAVLTRDIGRNGPIAQHMSAAFGLQRPGMA